MGRPFELHDSLKDVTLESVCDLADKVVRVTGDQNHEIRQMTEDLSFALEYLRLHYKLVPR